MMKHTACLHPRTPAARAACRKASAKLDVLAAETRSEMFRGHTIDCVNAAAEMAFECEMIDRLGTPEARAAGYNLLDAVLVECICL